MHDEHQSSHDETIEELLKKPKVPFLLRPLDRVVTWWVDRNIRLDKAMVSDDPKDLRSVRRSIFVRGVLILGFWIPQVIYLRLPLPLVLLNMFVGVAYATFWLERLYRANSYRSGWIDGRRSMREGFREARQRGMSNQEWIAAEFEKDLSIRL